MQMLNNNRLSNDRLAGDLIDIISGWVASIHSIWKVIRLCIYSCLRCSLDVLCLSYLVNENEIQNSKKSPNTT